MFNLDKKVVKSLLLLVISLLTISNSNCAEIDSNTTVPKQDNKKEIIKEEIKSLTWTETLALQDFILSPDYLELKSKIKEYKRILAKTYDENPAVFSSTINYGLLLIDLGEIDKAKIVWDKAVEDFHANETPKIYKAWIDARQGRYEEAKNIWYPIVKQKIDLGIVGLGARLWLPYHTDSLIGLYIIKDHLPENEREEVSKAIDTLAGVFPQNPKFAAIIVNEYLKTGQLKKAALVLADVLGTNPEDSPLITLLGIAQLLTNNYDEALNLFNRAKEANPNLFTARVMKARTLFALNREKESFEELDEVMRLNPRFTVAENKKKKYLSQKSYIVSKKVTIEKEIEEPKNIENKDTKDPVDSNKAFVPKS